LDGNDSPKLFLFHGRFWRNLPLQFLDFSYTDFKIFKREWTPKTLNFKSLFPLANLLSRKVYRRASLHKISFSIPEEKINYHATKKEKLFPMHIVDKELSSKLTNASFGYAFTKEQEYYHDLSTSKFGITTMRAGWDCMRHYEIAANGSVICFKNLASKPEKCAPHDLIPNINCLNYENHEDLMNQLNHLSNSEYEKLRSNSLEWVKNKSTKAIAQNFIHDIFN
jgi:hypothetical protein